MELSIVLQPWMVVPLFTTLAVVGLRVAVLREQDWRGDADGWPFFIVWAAVTVPALLVGWIK